MSITRSSFWLSNHFVFQCDIALLEYYVQSTSDPVLQKILQLLRKTTHLDKDEKNFIINSTLNNCNFVGVHGYNLTVNEKAASKKEAKGNDTYAKAPGNDKMAKGKVEGEDLLDDNAPETKDKTDFEGEDADGNKYDIGYNVREGEGSEGNMVEAPESGKNAKETKFVKNLSSFMNLAKAPGQEGDVDFEVNDEMGYNIQESDDLKKN